MKKIAKHILSVFIMIVSLFVFVGCDDVDNNDVNESNNSKNSNEYVLYNDSDPIEDDKVKIEISNPSCYGTDTYSLSMTFKITNKEYFTKEYEFKNMKLIKESTGAEYTVGGYFNFIIGNKLKIEAELNSSYNIGATIPSSIDTDKYILTLEINEYKITYYFIETPDELRADRKVNYYISDTLVKTDIIKDKRKIESLYVYESSDNLSYCNTWYTDENRKNQFRVSDSITADINLYGYPSSNIKWTALASDAYSFVDGINYVPSNGVLIIPNEYQNKEICIDLYAIRNIKVSEIYVPNTVHIIYLGNFTGIGNATIYYEGTEEEWKSLFYSSSSIVTKNVVYNTAYSN